jgi:hypothetical protein
VSEHPAGIDALARVRRACPVDLWLDPVSPASQVLMPFLDLDGHAHGGQPWRFRGRHCVGLRPVADRDDPVSGLVARCIVAVRAWAFQREGDDEIVLMDYDVPWSFLAGVQRDLTAVRQHRLSHLVALAGHEGDWLGDWLAEYHDHPAVHAAVDAEAAAATASGVDATPAITARGEVFGPATMPDDIHVRLARLIDA